MQTFLKITKEHLPMIKPMIKVPDFSNLGSGVPKIIKYVFRKETLVPWGNAFEGGKPGSKKTRDDCTVTEMKRV